jgi:hypothetical protein
MYDFNHTDYNIKEILQIIKWTCNFFQTFFDKHEYIYISFILGFFKLDFLRFFLVSIQEETYKWHFAMLFGCNGTHSPCSLAYAIRASPTRVGLPCLLLVLRPCGAKKIVRCS